MRRVIRLLGWFVVAATALAGAATVWYFYVPDELETRLRAIERQAMRGAEQGHWPGVMWAVVEPGEVVATGAAGFASLNEELRMSPQTTMPIGSITKVLAGLAGSIAVEEGVLNLDAPISDVLSFTVETPYPEQITFAHLATHTAGILDSDAGYEDVGYHFGATRHPLLLTDFLSAYLSTGGELYETAHFGDWAPGTVYTYSNVGAALAGQVISDAARQPYDEFTMERIVSPLGLSGFWGHIGPPDTASAPQATLYTRDPDGAFQALPPYGLATWPDGQFNASAADLARLMAMMMGDGELEGQQVFPASVILRQKTPRVMNLAGKEEPGDFIGLFWERETLRLGPLKLTFAGHSGGDPGVLTFMYHDPESPRGFVLMFNGEPQGLMGLLAIVRLARHLSR